MSRPPDERNPAGKPAGSQSLPAKEDIHPIAKDEAASNAVARHDQLYKTMLGSAQAGTILRFPAVSRPPRPQVWALPSSDRPGEWLVCVFVDTSEFVVAGCFATEVEALRCANEKAKLLGVAPAYTYSDALPDGDGPVAA